MQLFSKRPLCFFCFLFLIFTALGVNLALEAKPFLLIALGVLLLICILLLLVFKNKKLWNIILSVLLSVVFILLAVANTYFRMDVPKREAEKYSGEHGVEMLVVSKDRAYKYTTEYTVLIKQIGDEAVDIKASLLCDFKSRADCFDRIYALADIQPVITSDRDGVLLSVVIENADKARLAVADGDTVMDKAYSCGIDGIAIATGIIREEVSKYIVDLYGERAGALAAGLLMNDKSEIEPETIRDFRRTGVSHLLAVSGLHVSLLLGAVELLLRKLFIPKGVRCGILTVSALILLLLSGFSMSACRSVFMLFVLYINYMLAEENDSPTSLFFAVFIIVLINPYSIYDLGLLMSFLATLGLVTVYPPVEAAIGNLFYTRLPGNAFFSILKRIAVGIAITLVANIFLLPVMWYVFGEISVISPVVNLLVSPFVMVLLPCIAIGAIVGTVPLINEIFIVIVNLISYCMTEIISFFSSLTFATVSLEYQFADYIMYVFVIVMAVFMLIKLKRKWIIILPAVLSAVVFCVCLTVYNCVSDTSLYYYASNKAGMFVAVDDGKADVIDPTDGGVGLYRDVLLLAKENTAVSIDSIFICRVRYKHISCMEYVMSNNIVERLYLPRPDNSESAEICKEIYDIAMEHRVSVELYDELEAMNVANGVSYASVYSNKNVERDHGLVNILVTHHDNVIYYGNALSKAHERDIIEMSDVLIFGDHFCFDEDIYDLEIKENASVVFNSREKMKELTPYINGGKSYFVQNRFLPFDIDLLVN